MKNIVETTFELIEEKGVVTIPEIKAAISDLYSEISTDELETSIYSDLLNDGRFIYIDGKWDLTQKYTRKEIAREQYKVLGSIDQGPIDEVVADEIDDHDEPLGIVDVDPNDLDLLDLTEIDDLSEIKVYSQAEDDKN